MNVICIVTHYHRFSLQTRSGSCDRSDPDVALKAYSKVENKYNRPVYTYQSQTKITKCSIQHVTASIATRKLLINLGQRVNVVSFKRASVMFVESL